MLNKNITLTLTLLVGHQEEHPVRKKLSAKLTQIVISCWMTWLFHIA